jgi:hypothetical protein
MRAGAQHIHPFEGALRGRATQLRSTQGCRPGLSLAALRAKLYVLDSLDMTCDIVIVA